MNPTKWTMLLACLLAIAVGCDSSSETDGGTTPMEDAGGEDDAGDVETNTIADIALEAETFTNLLGAAALIGLDGPLADPDAGPFTVFAPTDAAFEQAFDDLGVTDTTALLSNTDLVNAILRYHVIDGEVRSTDITAPGLTNDTLNGLTLFFAPGEGTVQLNGGSDEETNGGANVTTADLDADNGVVHVIDRLLLPPDIIAAAVYATRSGNASLGELAGALEGEGLTSTFQVDILDNFSDLDCFGTDPAAGCFTVFAPVDDGFPDTPPDGLARILAYHVVSGAVPSSGIPDNAPSIQEDEYTSEGTTVNVPLTLFFTTDGGTVRVNGGSGADADNLGANVVAADITTLNGVVHVVDQVLLPLSIVGIAQVAGFDTLVSAVLASADLGDTPVAALLDGDAAAPLTVFAPTNDAFATAFPDGLPTGDGAPEALLGVLGLHVLDLPTPVLAEGLPDSTDAQFPPLAGSSLFFDTSATPPTVNVVDGASADIIVTDLGAANGVVHVIDAVLLEGT